MRIINRPLGADMGGRRWLSVQCDCGHGISHCDSNKDVTCPLCHCSQPLEGLLAEYTERKEAERRLRYGRIRRLARHLHSGARLAAATGTTKEDLAAAEQTGYTRAVLDVTRILTTSNRESLQEAILGWIKEYLRAHPLAAKHARNRTAALSYAKALAEARRVGAFRATGDALLAQTCFALSLAHAVNPKMLYDGAKANGLSAKELMRLARDDPGAFASIQFDAP